MPMKANKLLVCIRRGFINLNESVLLQLYKSVWFDLYIRIWKLIWGPHYVLGVYNGMQQNFFLRDESYID